MGANISKTNTTKTNNTKTNNMKTNNMKTNNTKTNTDRAVKKNKISKFFSKLVDKVKTKKDKNDKKDKKSKATILEPRVHTLANRTLRRPAASPVLQPKRIVSSEKPLPRVPKPWVETPVESNLTLSELAELAEDNDRARSRYSQESRRSKLSASRNSTETARTSIDSVSAARAAMATKESLRRPPVQVPTTIPERRITVASTQGIDPKALYLARLQAEHERALPMHMQPSASAEALSEMLARSAAIQLGVIDDEGALDEIRLLHSRQEFESQLRKTMGSQAVDMAIELSQMKSFGRIPAADLLVLATEVSSRSEYLATLTKDQVHAYIDELARGVFGMYDAADEAESESGSEDDNLSEVSNQATSHQQLAAEAAHQARLVRARKGKAKAGPATIPVFGANVYYDSDSSEDVDYSQTSSFIDVPKELSTKTVRLQSPPPEQRHSYDRRARQARELREAQAQHEEELRRAERAADKAIFEGHRKAYAGRQSADKVHNLQTTKLVPYLAPNPRYCTAQAKSTNPLDTPAETAGMVWFVPNCDCELHETRQDHMMTDATFRLYEIGLDYQTLGDCRFGRFEEPIVMAPCTNHETCPHQFCKHSAANFDPYRYVPSASAEQDAAAHHERERRRHERERRRGKPYVATQYPVLSAWGFEEYIDIPKHEIIQSTHVPSRTDTRFMPGNPGNFAVPVHHTSLTTDPYMLCNTPTTSNVQTSRVDGGTVTTQSLSSPHGTVNTVIVAAQGLITTTMQNISPSGQQHTTQSSVRVPQGYLHPYRYRAHYPDKIPVQNDPYAERRHLARKVIALHHQADAKGKFYYPQIDY
ncbi:hypothetical protein PYCC9005_004617 [Savitreella phatthalungensis]